MAGFTKRKIKNSVLIFVSILSFSCANQLPPGGGEVDRIPPRIVESFPESGTVNFEEDYFELEFSEYVDKRSVQDAIFISPAFDESLELDWSGKSVQVNFPSKLKENTTYVVTIGTDVVDYNNKNRMAQSFTFIFSTGSEIDKRVVKGTVHAEEPSGILIFAYKFLPDTLSDDENILINKPDFISQTGSSGTYKLLGLSEGNYRIFAVRDEFYDLLYQFDQDKIGMPFKDITFSESDTLFEDLNFFITSFDTIKPRLISASMTDKYHILINFSEEFDTSIVKASNFYIYDSTANKKTVPAYAFKGLTKLTEMVLAVDEDFPSGNNVYLFADTIKDKHGNIYLSDHISLTLSDKPDTTGIKISKVEPSAASENIDFIDQEFVFYFNDAFNIYLAKQAVTFSDTLGDAIPFNLKVLDDAAFKIEVKKNLEPDKNYIISIDLSKFEDVAGNFGDTVYTYEFKTISGLDFTGVQGKLLGVDDNKNPILVLQNVEKEEIVYKEKPDKNSKFVFDRITPGKYSLWCFLDEDSSMTYSFGYPFPFKFSEQFIFYPDTLNLRARWVQTDIMFKFE